MGYGTSAKDKRDMAYSDQQKLTGETKRSAPILDSHDSWLRRKPLNIPFLRAA